VETSGPTAQDLLRAALATTGVRVAIVDRQGVFIEASDQGVLSPSGERGAPAGANAFALYADFPEVLARVKRAFEGLAQHIGFEGMGGFIDAHFVPWRGPSGSVDYVIVVATYITERHMAERALEQSRGREHRIFASNMIGMLIWNEKGAIFDANDTLLDMLGYTRDDMQTGRLDLLAITPPEYRALDAAALVEIRQRGACTPFEKEYIKKDGTRLAIIVGGASWEPGSDAGIAFVLDRTERVRQQRQRDASEELLRRVVETAPVVLWSVDKDAIFTLSTGRALRDLGLAPGEVVGRSSLEMYATVPGIIDGIRRGLAGEELTNVVEAAGRWFETLYAPLRDKAGQVAGLLGLSIDITERRTAEQEQEQLRAQLLQAQKLESLGILAGGIAHDFNNILTAILGSATVALRTIPNENPARDDIENIVAAARRAANLTRQMLAYSGKGHFDVRPIDISEQVREITQLLETTVPKKVQLRLELGRDLPAVEVDIAQLQQIVMNLVINGAEAIGDDPGTVHVVTGVEEVGSSYASSSSSIFSTDGLAPGKYVFLEVADTGHGMDDATKAKIFDPFFTTKFAGRGLGLAAVLGIVRAHQAAIEVRSIPRKGSTFRVLFRASREAPARAEEDSDCSYRNSGLVLVIDDDAGSRRALRRALELFGFSVEEAVDGAEGAALFAERAEQVVLVIVDMTMPKMGGDETLREIRRRSASVPVILTSGYSQVEAMSRFTAKDLAGFLEKPFTTESLATKLRAILPPSE
jgi:PAS domain S-box-containing protein